MSTSRLPGRKTSASTCVEQSRRTARGAVAVDVRAVAATRATASAVTRSFLTSGVLLEPRCYGTPAIGVALQYVPEKRANDEVPFSSTETSVVFFPRGFATSL